MGQSCKNPREAGANFPDKDNLEMISFQLPGHP